MTIAELKSLVRDYGIVGAGGAGFPTYEKIDAKIEMIVLNCAECEPLLKLHRQLLERKAREILKTLHHIAQIVGASQVIIGIKYEYKATIRALEIEILDFPEITVHSLVNAYPMGDEVELIYETTKRLVKPGRLPIEEGVVVFNVETIYNTYQAMEKQLPVTEKLVTVTGEVVHPASYRLPLGCSLKEAIEIAGGSKNQNPALLIGGPMMGHLGEESDVITKTTNAIIVLPQSHEIIKGKQKNIRNEVMRAESACCQCQACTDLCPRHELGYPIEPHKFMRGLAFHDATQTEVYQNLFFCSLCGLCELYSCPQGLSPRSLIATFRTELKKAGVQPNKDLNPKPILESRIYKYVPEERLIARLGLKQYDVEAPMMESVYPVKKVKILLSQHIGIPSICCVKEGEQVVKGQVIAKPAKGLCVAQHASISGTVMETTKRYVLILAKESKADE